MKKYSLLLVTLAMSPLVAKEPLPVSRPGSSTEWGSALEESVGWGTMKGQKSGYQPLLGEERENFELSNKSDHDIAYFVHPDRAKSFTELLKLGELHKTSLRSGKSFGAMNLTPGETYYVYVYSSSQLRIPDALWVVEAGKKTTYLKYTTDENLRPQLMPQLGGFRSTRSGKTMYRGANVKEGQIREEENLWPR